jgi:hypothetical protein
MSVPTEIELEWLSRFFSAPNELSWENIRSNSGPIAWLAQVSPWIALIRKHGTSKPIVLPLFGPGDAIAWYGMTDSEQLMSQLLDELNAYVGPGYCDRSVMPDQRFVGDEIGTILQARFGSNVIRFSPRGESDRREIERMLLLYQSVLARRPAIQDRTIRPFGKIRGDFDRALLAGNQTAARAFAAELHSTGRVNAEQKQCLDIRLMAGLGRQEELARSQGLISSVVDLSLPPQTIVDLVEALYETFIEPLERTADLSLIDAAFSLHIGRHYGGLFRERKGIRRPKVLLAFLLFERSQGQPNISRCDAIFANFPGDDERKRLAESWLKGLGTFLATSQLSSLESARQAIADEDYGVAVEFCFDALPSSWAYSGLLRCASELNSAELSARVVEVISIAESSITKGFTERDKERLARLTALPAAASEPNADLGWVQWATWVSIGTYDTPPLNALQKAIHGWSVADYAQDISACAELARLIGNAEGKAATVFRDAFPALVEFFVDGAERPSRAFVPIYIVLIKSIAWASAASADELELVTNLAQSVLRVGPTHDTYAECVGDLVDLLSANDSPVHLDWALNLAEVVAIYPSQAPEDRLRFFLRVFDLVRSHYHRVTFVQQSILGTLAEDFGCPDVVRSLPKTQVNEDGKDQANFTGLMGIYTLTEGAGQRAREMLERLFPAARIELNGDAVATDRLKQLARDSDLFVFAWKSSKHQAFNCVKSARGDRELLLPLGKGTASIVRSVLDYLHSPSLT